MEVNASIFKAYDIRGIVGETLDEKVAFHIGKAFGRIALQVGEKTVAVGRDGRLSGPVLSGALIDGLASVGVHVIDVGAVTSPMLYFAATKYCQSGIQVTGSHNPKNYNGFKMVLAGQAIYGDTIQMLYQRIVDEDYVQAPVAGDVKALDIFEDYQQAIVSSIALSRPIKVVIDCGNGITGTSSPAILKAIGCDVVAELFTEVDGNFPNHHPDPSKSENLEDLRRAVKATGAELGLAFDGDGDRLGVVTADGQEIFPDRQLILFARDVLSRCPGAPIVFDVKCTQQMIPAIREAGGIPYMSTTGHSLVKAKMNELNSPLGGEMSGHIFFKERWYGFDDATYSAARLLEILSRSDDPSAVLNSLPIAFSTPELNIACPQNNAHELVRQVVAIVQEAPEFKQGAEISTLDGVRVDWKDGFGLIRASNTTPVLVLRFEGQTQEALQRIQKLMMKMLHKVLPSVQ
ncbi:MAG: phosphomannomutase/phosphoglucomutase [Saezia sp.]